jgi:hypothetical protein
MALAAESSSTTKKRRRSRRPTKRAKFELIPPIDCGILNEISLDTGDDLLRKTQHNEDCQKYFECVQNRWVDRLCPIGTTFNGQAKQCDSNKTCKPSRIAELYEEGIQELKRSIGVGEEQEKF